MNPASPLAESGWIALAFILGAAIGSYIATLLLRRPLRAPSPIQDACDRCGARLEPEDRVPVLAWTLSRGRCRSCGARIDRRHLAAEGATVMVGLSAILAHPMPLAGASAILGWWLFLLAAIALEREEVPDRLVWPLLAAGLVAGWGGLGPPLEARLIGAAAGFAVLFLFARAFKGGGVGDGEAKLLAAIGAWLGWAMLPLALAGAALLAGIVWLAKGRGAVPPATLMAAAAWPVWIVMLA